MKNPEQIKLEGNLNFGKFYCPNCGKEGTISDSIHCDCKPRPKGQRAIDKEELWKIVSTSEGDFLVKIQEKR